MENNTIIEPETPLFTEFPLKPELLDALTSIGFERATPVQNMTINPILDGKDIFAQAETGSGKTGSFAIPLIEQMLRNFEVSAEARESDLVAYVVLSPTRELAQQTHKTFLELGSKLGINSICLIGGENIENQKDLLKHKPHVLVATPGRLCDLTKQKCVDLGLTKAVVFDEADRLFDMGFKKEIEFILNKMPDNRQLIMVSATTNMEVLNTAYKFKSMPVEMKLNSEQILVENIDHKIAMITRDEKMPLLVNLLRNHEDTYAIIFCNTQVQTHMVAEWLRTMDYKAMPISGALPQNKRTKLMEDFRAKKITILVCTDVAARGLDIKDVNLVINYDLPQEAANYVHRIGRTGRAGQSGEAISFCAFEDCEYLDPIYAYINAKIPKMELTNDSFAKDITRRPYLDFKTLKVVERDPPRERKEKPMREKITDNNKKAPQREEKEVAAKDFSPADKRTPETFKKYVPSKDPAADRRDFITTASSEAAVIQAAMGYFRVNDPELFDIQELKKGRPAFFFFGPRKNTYQVQLKSIFKKLLTPYIEEILNHARLRLDVRVSFKNNMITALFTGTDEGLMVKNRFELALAFEQLIKAYLSQKVRLSKDVKWEVVVGKNRAQETQNKGRGDNASDRGPRQTRPARPGSTDQNSKFKRGGNGRINEKELIGLVENMKQQVLETKQPVMLKPLSSAERRIIHQHLSDDSTVKTSSIGDGQLKRIEIALR